MQHHTRAAFILGGFIGLSLIVSAWVLSSTAIQFKEYERVVKVKGLAEHEVPADVAVWPIRFVAASNNLTELYQNMGKSSTAIQKFLVDEGFTVNEITNAAPLVTDKFAERYGDQDAKLRYSALQTITVYSNQVDLVRESQRKIAELGQQGIAFSGDEYSQRITYMFTKLNDLKPALIEESVKNARLTAQKFAADSDSKLGKLRIANQGQISIQDRDDNTPYLKKIRVVSTVEYYLVD